MTPENYYRQVIEDCRKNLTAFGKRSLAVAMLRLTVFAATVAAVAVAWDYPAAAAACFLTGTGLFLYLAKQSNRIAGLRQAEEARKNWAEQNILRIGRNLDGLPAGEEYTDPEHDYTFDIDVFGRKSLYALINSTATPYGGHLLANWLRHPEAVADSVEARQQAVKELASNSRFREAMASAGKVAADENLDAAAPIGPIPDFSISLPQKAAVKAVPFIYVILFALMAFDIVPGLLIFNLFIAVLLISSLQAKRVGRLHRWVTRTAEGIASCSEIFRTIESEPFQSAELQALQRNVNGTDGRASVHTRRLLRCIHNLDQRYNAFGYAIMNGFLLWDWRQLDHIDRWMQANGKHIEEWREAIAGFDAYCALASFAFNNPGYTYPRYDRSRQTVMEAQSAGHPLLPPGKCVCNDIPRLASTSFFVITGANMAGKSTYLRTVAVNYLLALTGAPVYADSMTFSKATLFTGLRTSDSLADGASYFFAELSRLQKIVRRAESGERMFVILDEILRGTNSTDKQKGSIGLICKLLNYSVAGLIATHDLALGSLADSFPGKVANFRFEAETAGNSLTFSYRLQPGIAENTNAFFLMKTMGII